MSTYTLEPAIPDGLRERSRARKATFMARDDMKVAFLSTRRPRYPAGAGAGAGARRRLMDSDSAAPAAHSTAPPIHATS